MKKNKSIPIDLVSNITAKLAKDKGFDEPTVWYLDNEMDVPLVTREDDHTPINWNDLNNPSVYSVPTQAQLKDWLRRRFDCYVEDTVEFYGNGVNCLVQVFFYDPKDVIGEYIGKKSSGQYGDNGEYSTPEEAIEKGLKLALERI